MGASIYASAVSAVLGFVLAQFVNLAKLVYERWKRPKLTIECRFDNNEYLSHDVEYNPGEFIRERIFGCYIKNSGKSIAAKVRVQLIKIEIKSPNWTGYTLVWDQVENLYQYSTLGIDKRTADLVLVPGSSALIQLANWDEVHSFLAPSIRALPDYYEESVGAATVYQFTIVAFGEKVDYVQETIQIKV